MGARIPVVVVEVGKEKWHDHAPHAVTRQTDCVTESLTVYAIIFG